jgi:hypothetical protein
VCVCVRARARARARETAQACADMHGCKETSNMGWTQAGNECGIQVCVLRVRQKERWQSEMAEGGDPARWGRGVTPWAVNCASCLGASSSSGSAEKNVCVCVCVFVVVLSLPLLWFVLVNFV